jgi:hypothetical protein
MSSRRSIYLTVRLTTEESRRLAEAARQRGYRKIADFVRASLGRGVTQGQLTEEVHGLEKRQAATLAAVRAEIARLQRTEYVIFAMLDNLAKSFLTYLPPVSAESKAAAIAHGKAGYERYLKAVGMSLHNDSKTALESLAGEG